MGGEGWRRFDMLFLPATINIVTITLFLELERRRFQYYYINYFISTVAVTESPTIPIPVPTYLPVSVTLHSSTEVEVVDSVSCLVLTNRTNHPNNPCPALTVVSSPASWSFSNI